MEHTKGDHELDMPRGSSLPDRRPLDPWDMLQRLVPPLVQAEAWVVN